MASSLDTPNAKMRRRRDRPFRDFDALRTSSRQGGSSVGASVPMMSVETATSAPEVDVAAPGPFGLGRDRVSGPCLVSHLSTRRVSANRKDRIPGADARTPSTAKSVRLELPGLEEKVRRIRSEGRLPHVRATAAEPAISGAKFRGPASIV